VPGRTRGAALDRLQPDVLFLDIQMPELDGFDVIRRRSPERMPAVVFLTAYSKFALRAFEAEAHDYLVKPVTEARFAATMKRLVRRLTTGTAPLPEPGIAVSTTRATKILPLKEID
jgi:two-component system LytT family response regulator